MRTDRPQIGLYFHVHLVSDSTGETLVNVMKASVVQFERALPIEHLYALVRSPRQLDRVLSAIADYPGIVMYTIVNDDLRRELELRCAELGVPCVAVLDPLLASLSRYLGAPLTNKAGAQHHLDDEYHRRIEAVNFAMAHDDGQLLHELNDADVVLIGVSRTSKTPTCIYLAQRGVKAANVPLVNTQDLTSVFDRLHKPLVVGLTATPDRLVQVRKNRLLTLQEGRQTSYVEADAVRDEIVQAKRLFARRGWPVIDVTRRSIEETAAKILNLLSERQAKTP